MTEQEPISVLQLVNQLAWAERKYGKNSTVAWELRRQILEARRLQGKELAR